MARGLELTPARPRWCSSSTRTSCITGGWASSAAWAASACRSTACTRGGWPRRPARGTCAAGTTGSRRLLTLADRIGRPAVLLPTDDAGAIFLAEHGAGLRPRFIFPDPPRDLPRQVAGKFSLYELCRELGIPSPAAAVPPTAAAAREFAAQAGYPLIAKLTTPWASSRRSTSILTSPAELDDAFRGCAREGAGLMLQEFIPGGRDTDWFFHGYCDATSLCRPAFTGVKERSYPAHAGLTSLGRSEPNADLRDQVTPLLGKLGYQGLLDLDLRLDRG